MLRLLVCLQASFDLCSKMTVGFLHGKDNVVVYQLSRWTHYKGVKDLKNEDMADLNEVRDTEYGLYFMGEETVVHQDQRGIVTSKEAMWVVGHQSHFNVRKT